MDSPPTGVPITFVPSVIDWDGHFDEQGRQDRLDLAPGSANWVNDQSDKVGALLFVCPCGCGKTHAINVSIGPKQEHSWAWNGDTLKPSLTPSIQCLSKCRWHGYLTDGAFVPC